MMFYIILAVFRGITARQFPSCNVPEFSSLAVFTYRV
jgi:hypothetical protein